MTPPNVIVLIVDALRAQNVSCYGYEYQTTTHIDRFAQENLLFRRAFAPATWTIPSHASLLTGLHVSQHRIENVKANRRLHPAIVTLPEALRRHGYSTTLFTQNRLFSPKHDFNQFEQWYGFGRQFDEPGKRQEQEVNKGISRFVSHLNHYRRKLKNSRVLFDTMLRCIDKSDRPFLMMANVTDVHYPWAAPPLSLVMKLGQDLRHLVNREMYDPNPFQFNSQLRPITDRHRAIWRTLYDLSISHIDNELGRFLQALGRRNTFANTILVITADHGEMLGVPRDIFGHTLTLHDHVMHVPLVVRHPDYRSTIVEGVVQTLSLFPSVLEWCGVPQSGIPAAQLQSPGFSRAIEAPDELGGYAFAEEDYSQSYDVRSSLLRMNPKLDPDRYPVQQIAIRSARHKFLWRSDGKHELYDLEADPAETSNRFGDKALATEQRQLQEQLDQWRNGLELFPPVELEQDITVAQDVRKRLQELGYLVPESK